MQDDNQDQELNEINNMADTIEQAQTIPPPEGEKPEPPPVSPEMQAYGMARMICELAAKGAQMRWECLSYNDEIKNQGAQVLVPVLLKYDMQNEFFAKYAEEFAAGAFFAGVIYTSYMKVQAHKAEQAAKNAKEVKTEGEGVSA